MRAWINHAAINAGLALYHLRALAGCLWFGTLPPQATHHTPADIETLRSGSAREWFLRGLRD